MPGAETVKLQVELVEKNAEARLKALDKLAQEMGNRKITLNFDEASLARWKAATDGMTNAQLSAYAKLATAAENASAKIISAGQKTTQVEMQQNAKLAIDRQKSFDKKIALYEKEDTKRRQIAEKTAQTEINANAKVQVATLKGVQGTRQHTQAQRELNTEAEKTDSIFSSITSRFTAANLISSLITAAVSKLRQALRQAVDEMKEMDKELTTIKMVSGASDSYISQLTDQAFAGARANGRSVTDYLSAAEMFTRAGYRDNIDQLSQLALMTQNIGGVEEEVAGKFLLAADAAWKLGGSYDALMGVLDGVSSVADQNATDLGKIAEGITIAGTAMANAGVSAKEFTAMLGLTTASTQRSGSEMARGLRTILFRVRQVKAEFDDGEVIDADDISNAAKALKEVANIDVIDKQTNDLKSFSDIMSELAEKWVTLDDKQKQYLQNALAGQRQGNVLFAWLENWDKYEELMQQYEDSAGTAVQKNETYTSSWEAATNDLNTAWVSLVGTITDSGGTIQDIVKLLTTAIDKFNEWEKKRQGKQGEFELYAGERALRESFEQKHPKTDTFESESGNMGGAGTHFETDQMRAKDAYAQRYMWSGYAQSVKKTDEEIKKYTDDAGKAGDETDDLAKSTEKAATAFDKQRDKISEVAKAIKEEKNDAVNSLADIYKAAMNAADKGYYGSNAYRQGGALFFSEENLETLRKEGKLSAKEYLDAYFEEAESGNYSTAAANFFGKITEGSNEIKAKNGEVLASVKDIGDAYEWTFNKGEMGMDDYLKSLSSSTGISESFWASMIESLGMYSDEMAEWVENNGEVSTEAEFDSNDASSAIEEYIKLISSIPAEAVTIVRTIYESGTTNTGAAYSASKAQADGYKLTQKYQHKATGKHDRYSGIALVNDEFPADGSKPELIISKSQGRAYIANGGKPALVNLRSDDVVLTAKETESAMGGIPTFEDGTADPWSWLGGAMREVAKKVADAFDGKKVETPKEEDGGGGNNKGKKKPDADKTWAELKKLIEYLLDKAEGDLKDQLKVLDDMLEEMENSRKAEQEAKKLEELQTAAQEALVDLQRAQTERTVRYYNEETQQWEWMADQGSVEKAQEAYNNALDNLKEYEDDLAYKAKKAEIEAQKDALQEQYNLMKDGWDDIVDAIEAPSGDIEKLLNTLIQYGTPTMQEQSGGIADLLNKLRDGLFGAGYELGLGNINANTKNSGTTSSTVFDDGGFAYGSGMMRKGSGTETVIGPGLTREILNPVKNERFSSFVDSLRYLVDGGNGSFSFGNRSSITNNNGGNYYVNGVSVGSDMAQRPFAEVMKTIAIHANESL